MTGRKKEKSKILEKLEKRKLESDGNYKKILETLRKLLLQKKQILKVQKKILKELYKGRLKAKEYKKRQLQKQKIIWQRRG